MVFLWLPEVSACGRPTAGFIIKPDPTRSKRKRSARCWKPPGHDRPRCVYVYFLNTGPAVSKTLRTVVTRDKSIRKAGDLLSVDLMRHEGEVVGTVALHLGSGAPVVIT